jgi:anti-sigma regulatory factor (Ser/Thr protein kinase)
MDTSCGPDTSYSVPGRRYRHEAFLYAGLDEFLGGSVRFIEEATSKGEPVLVVVSAAKIDALRGSLNGLSDSVGFADMAEVGQNPGRIIAAWQEYLGQQSVPGRQVHGIGEPISAERSPAELVECQNHEALLNVAFRDHDFRLMCPYDTSILPEDVVNEALRTHPLVFGCGESTASSSYPGVGELAVPSRRPLPSPPEWAYRLAFRGTADLLKVRHFVALHALAAGLGSKQSDDVVLAANEMATNSIRYGDNQGTLRAWWETGSFICEFSDRGVIDEPMVGRLRPDTEQTGGRGFWLANHLCDLVQVRVFETGSVVRLHSYITP